MKTGFVCIGALLSIAFSSMAFGHSGGLDSNGGHFNRKTGEYHYHRKPAPPPAPAAASTATVPAYSSAPVTFPELKRRLLECRATTDSLARLSCFETLTDSLP